MLDRNTPTEAAADQASELFSPRQEDVLAVALKLLVDGGGKGFTTARLAKAANCSKESLYKWFGDRNGLLAAMISYQASKVRVAASPDIRIDENDFRRQLTAFASDLLTVLSGPTSLALNRLAIGEAGREGAELGKLLIERGRRAIEQRAARLIEAGRAAGHLEFNDRDEAFNTLYGLIVGDMHVRMLLGDTVPALSDAANIDKQAARAVEQFRRLYAGGEQTTRTNT
jgi:AcrR family transcriptional regulator